MQLANVCLLLIFNMRIQRAIHGGSSTRKTKKMTPCETQTIKKSGPQQRLINALIKKPPMTPRKNADKSQASSVTAAVAAASCNRATLKGMPMVKASCRMQSELGSPRLIEPVVHMLSLCCHYVASMLPYESCESITTLN